MITIIGNFALYMILILASCSVVLKSRYRIQCFYSYSAISVIAFLVLLIGFIVSDFSIKNVFFNSSTILPLIYKISACWASHEGSMLLWFALLSLVSVCYIYNAKFSDSIREFGIVIFAFIAILFCSFIIFTSNPFDQFSFLSNEGLGLNPMLQDIALAIHPPLLYLGNVTYITLFVSGCLVLCQHAEQRKILIFAKQFSNFALMALSAGIGLGSWWAYRELGWGGYWFFDPVENISLMPWLIGIALHHFLIVTIRDGKFIVFTTILSILSFLLTIYGTFIVRSGIIASVHSFAFSPERGLYILLICIVITILSLVLFIIRRKNLTGSVKEWDQDNYSMQSTLLFNGNMLWILSLISIIISLIYPIYCHFIDGTEVSIDQDYFISVFLPIHIPILFLAAITPFVRNNKLLDCFTWNKVISLLIAISLSCYIHYYIQSLTTLLACAIVSSVYLMLSMLEYIIIESCYFSKQIFFKKYSLFFGHFGLGLLVLAISINSLLSQEVEFVGKIGDQVESNNISVKLTNITFTQNTHYFRQIADLDIHLKGSSEIITLKPENRLYKIENSLSQEVDIYSYMFYDLYAVMNKVNKDTIHARIYYHPFISFIWLSVFMIAGSFCLLYCCSFKSQISSKRL